MFNKVRVLDAKVIFIRDVNICAGKYISARVVSPAYELGSSLHV